MHLSSFLAAAVAITSVQASPFLDLDARSVNALQPRDLSGSKCVDYVYGATNTKLGQVCVSISGGTMTITYPTLPTGGSYTDLHANVQTTPITEDNQGKWPYTLGKGSCKISADRLSATCTVPILDAWRKCNSDLYIGVHASFDLPGKGGNTGWGDGTCISTRPNCPKYFTFTTKCECSVVTTYDPYTTSLVYVITKTVFETLTTSCSTTPAAVTATATCTNPGSAAIETVKGGTTAVAGFTCATPATTPA
ncbi:hypothetical protein CC80DRAFT_549314 [Byssothecium circinans]|uniref:Uncharacterized protein n=1 Tax=Byssothecium circinans TaxID=147558 RepID=A0A6A5TTJ4_9PLEO|nr:hypothetical protein CC80DRAFT_549314 [Byssothecium circinans]